MLVRGRAYMNPACLALALVYLLIYLIPHDWVPGELLQSQGLHISMDFIPFGLRFPDVIVLLLMMIRNVRYSTFRFCT
jgi:hypothetical protein